MIKEIRIKKGLSQKQLSDAVGISQARISEYETGKRKPKIETLAKIAKALDTDEVFLIYGMSPEEYLEYQKEDRRRGVIAFNEKRALQRLTKNYNAANSAGKQKIVEYSEDIIKIQEYKEEQ